MKVDLRHGFPVVHISRIAAVADLVLFVRVGEGKYRQELRPSCDESCNCWLTELVHEGFPHSHFQSGTASGSLDKVALVSLPEP